MSRPQEFKKKRAGSVIRRRSLQAQRIQTGKPRQSDLCAQSKDGLSSRVSMADSRQMEFANAIDGCLGRDYTQPRADLRILPQCPVKGTNALKIPDGFPQSLKSPIC